MDINTAEYFREDAPPLPVEVPLKALLAVPDDSALSLKYEKKADRLFARLSKTFDQVKALELAGKTTDMYKKAVLLNKGKDSLVHKYCIAIEVMYNLIVPDNEKIAEKKKVYADTLAMLEKFHSGGDKSIYANYDLALLSILNLQYFNVFQVLGAVNKLRDSCELVYSKDVGFEKYTCAAALGRIHYLAPNIPILIPWPDKKLSRKYLEEVLQNTPDSLLVKFFLADTLYALGEKEKAAGMFREIMSAKPRQSIEYFQDLKTQRNCGVRMKELGIQLLITNY